MDYESLDFLTGPSGAARKRPNRVRVLDVEDEDVAVAEAGDIGDRIFSRNRLISSVTNRSSAFYYEEESETEESEEAEDQKNDESKVTVLDYMTTLLSLAMFGILGVLTRNYLLQLIGPDELHKMYPAGFMQGDLLPNVVGSFLMGWFLVFKKDIMKVSDQLAIGLSTGFLGSLTSFAKWNQKMLDLSSNGHTFDCFCSTIILCGLFLFAFRSGTRVAKGFKYHFQRSNSTTAASVSKESKRFPTFVFMLFAMLVLLPGIFYTLGNKEFKISGSEAELLVACIVAPWGVWIRWSLARFNGRGLGKNWKLKWIPFGTFLANVLAACLMAGLAALKKAVKTEMCDTVASGFQFGLVGCLSTVSMFVAEFDAMLESRHPARGHYYPMLTLLISFVLGNFIYY